MRYLLSAKVRPQKAAHLVQALESGSFAAGFPYGDLGDLLREARVDETGTLRWVEVCYCRGYYGVAMEEELPYLEEFLTEIVVADARSPRSCKGYPVCNDCDCTRKIRFVGEPFMDYLHRVAKDSAPLKHTSKSTRWLGWRGLVTPEEARRNS